MDNHKWEDVCVTPQEFTSPFHIGARALTSIRPMYIIKLATQQFGLVGIGWGWNIIKEDFIEGIPIAFDSTGAVTVRETIHRIELELWYMQGSQKGTVRQFGLTPFIYRRMVSTVDGVAIDIGTNRDFAKMTLTDAIGKCLSYLGFGADVYLGQHGQDCDESQINHEAQSCSFSQRYMAILDRLNKKNEPIADIALAREIINQDKDCSAEEIQLLLKHSALSVKNTN